MDWIDTVTQDIAELDYSSIEGQPEVMQVTAAELRVILERSREPEIDRLRDALTELRDRIKHHPAWDDLTEEEEMRIGGDTAELSYLSRIADAALATSCSIKAPAAVCADGGACGTGGYCTDCTA